MPQSLLDKVWDAHTVTELPSGQTQLFIGLHLIHEVTSPQAFAMLRELRLPVLFPQRTVATVDHIIPTHTQVRPFDDEQAETMMTEIERSCRDHGIRFFDRASGRQGIVHVIGPELGLTQPGMTIVCGDSHTATHGAFGALAFGIGTSEVEHVLATQTLLQYRPKTLELRVEGPLPAGVTAKDLILYLIGKIGTDGGSGYCIEYTGPAIRNFSMEERMTVCNMSIEAGARAGMIAPDDKTFAYLQGRQFAPCDFDAAVARWRHLPSDPGAKYDRVEVFQAADVQPQVTWGTNPGQVVPITGKVPAPADFSSDADRKTAERSLEYMNLKPGTAITSIQLDRVFIGSCTNSRIEDLRAAAKVVRGHKVSDHVRAMVVPGSGQVKKQAEAESLDAVFKAAGFEWRDAGCSMCLGMNPDILSPGERCASTSNRNFEGRQGKGGRTHLVSPAMAAAAAVAGHFVDIREWDYH